MTIASVLTLLVPLVLAMVLIIALAVLLWIIGLMIAGR